MTDYRAKLIHRPPLPRDGDKVFPVPARWVEKNDEAAVAISFICNRRLFGLCYKELVPDLYQRMGKRSGVMIAPLVPIGAVIPTASFPGDLDLLVIPYDEGELLLSEALAIEVKVVRAKYAKPGKAPNEFGFSQANATFAHGIPYAAVAHLIVSDTSPPTHWRRMHIAQVVNVETGELDNFKEAYMDMLPADLIDRSFGRLVANCPTESIGLISSYIAFAQPGFWMPNVRSATKNPDISASAANQLARFYNTYHEDFLDTPKYPPSS